jgi:hypothetical protein
VHVAVTYLNAAQVNTALEARDYIGWALWVSTACVRLHLNASALTVVSER